MAERRNKQPEERGKVVPLSAARNARGNAARRASGGSQRTPGQRPSGQRRNSPPTGTRKKNKLKQQQKAALGVAALLIVILILYFALRKNGMEVFAGEDSLGIVPKGSITQEELLDTITAQLEAERGAKIQINEEIVFKPIHCNKKDFVTTDTIITDVRKAITYKVEAASITADGVEIGIMNNVEEANALLDSIIADNIPEDSTIDRELSGFVQNVEVKQRYVDSSEIMSAEQTRNKFTEGQPTQTPYTIVSGDSIDKIARNANMTREELLAANPGMTIDTPIIVGQQMNIIVNTPFLSVKTVEISTYVDRIEKQVEYQNDNTKSKSYKKLVQQGKDGQEQVTVQIIRIDGVEQERKIVDRQTIQEAVKEIIIVGTK